MGKNKRFLARCLALVVVALASACATGSEDLRAEIRTLRQELRAEIQDQRDGTAALVDDLRRENRAERERLAGDIKAELTESLARFETHQEQRAAEWDARIEDISERSETTAKNCDLSILEMRKELFESKRSAEERNRRLNVLESTVDVPAEGGQRAGREDFVTFVEGNLVSVSVGGGSVIREGSTINIFKKDEPERKIASAKITSVDLDSASGEIFYKVDSVAIGDRVEAAE